MSEQIRIEYMPLGELRRYPKNAKDHDLGLLNQSIGRFGFVEPIVVNEATGVIVAGHGRLDTLEAMQADDAAPPDRIEARGDDWYVPVVRGVSFANEDEFRAYVIGANRTVEAGGWHEELLLDELKALAEAQVPFDGIGYDTDDLDAMIRAQNWEMDAEAPDVDDDPVTVRGYGLKVTLYDEASEDELYFELRRRNLKVERLSGKKGE